MSTGPTAPVPFNVGGKAVTLQIGEGFYFPFVNVPFPHGCQHSPGHA